MPSSHARKGMIFLCLLKDLLVLLKHANQTIQTSETRLLNAVEVPCLAAEGGEQACGLNLLQSSE